MTNTADNLILENGMAKCYHIPGIKRGFGRSEGRGEMVNHMAKIETSYERNLYWALDGKERVDYLKERVSDDLRQLLWDLWAYSVHANLNEEKISEFDAARETIEQTVDRLL